MMKNPYDILIVAAARKLSLDIDEFVVQRFIDLFKEGVLELGIEPGKGTVATYPYTSADMNDYTYHVNQKVYLRYRGDEKIAELEEENQTLKRCLSPKEWTDEQNNAWHRNIPDVIKAFDALRATTERSAP